MSYRTFHVNGEIFKGGEPQDSKWNEMPNSSIKVLEYDFLGETIVLENYEEYNHLVERVAFVNTGGQGISKVLLMAKQASQVLKITINFIKKRVDYDVVEFGKEYNNKPTTGWKEGLKGLKGNSRIK